MINTCLCTSKYSIISVYQLLNFCFIPHYPCGYYKEHANVNITIINHYTILNPPEDKIINVTSRELYLGQNHTFTNNSLTHWEAITDSSANPLIAQDSVQCLLLTISPWAMCIACLNNHEAETSPTNQLFQKILKEHSGLFKGLIMVRKNISVLM